MAKSSSFFGLRRGSTKSLTFQVLDGKQITKDRVTSVRNPKSNGQIMQRMKMTAATIFGRYFRDIIERGQQGVTYGIKSYQKWLSQALKTPNLYAAKGQTTLMAWPMPLTKGSLPTFAYNYIGQVSNLILPAGTDDADAVTDAQILANNPQLMDGDQIAVVELLKNQDGSLLVKTAKHILNSENTAANSLARDFFAQGIEVSDYTPDVAEGDTAVTYVSFGYPDTVLGMVGFACILSRLNGSTYERSSQELAVQDGYFTKAFINTAYDSYRDADQRTTDWPEIIEDGFIPMGYAGITIEGEDSNGNVTHPRVAYVYGFNGSEYKKYVVGTAAQSGNPTLYTYPDLESINQVSASAVENQFDGYISKADFDTLFG